MYFYKVDIQHLSSLLFEFEANGLLFLSRSVHFALTISRTIILLSLSH